MINEDFIRKGNILKKHQTLLSLLAVVEVEVGGDGSRGGGGGEGSRGGGAGFSGTGSGSSGSGGGTVVVMVVLRVQVVHQPLRQLLFPPFLPLHHFPSFPPLFVPRPFPYISRVLWRVLLTVLVFLLDYPFVPRVGHTGV